MTAYGGVLGTRAGIYAMAPVTWWGISIKWGVKPVTHCLAVTDLLCAKSLLSSVQRLISALTAVRHLCGPLTK